MVGYKEHDQKQGEYYLWKKGYRKESYWWILRTLLGINKECIGKEQKIAQGCCRLLWWNIPFVHVTKSNWPGRQKLITLSWTFLNQVSRDLFLVFCRHFRGSILLRAVLSISKVPPTLISPHFPCCLILSSSQFVSCLCCCHSLLLPYKSVLYTAARTIITQTHPVCVSDLLYLGACCLGHFPASHPHWFLWLIFAPSMNVHLFPRSSHILFPFWSAFLNLSLSSSCLS